MQLLDLSSVNQNAIFTLSLIGLGMLAFLFYINRRSSINSGQHTQPIHIRTLLTQLTNNLPIILFATDQNGIINTLEGSRLAELGPNPDKLIGRSVLEMYQEFPDVLSEINEALAGKPLFTMATMFDTVWDIWLSPIKGIDMNIIGIVGIAVDVTERNRAEALLQHQASLIQSVSDAIISTNLDMTVASWNQAAETIYGWKLDEVLGLPLNEVIHTQQSTGWDQNILNDIFETGYWQGEIIQNNRDKENIDISTSATLLADETGNPTGMVLVNRDITQIKRVAIQDMQLRIEKERLRFLQEFLSDTSHDLKTPLSTMRINLYLLKKMNPTLSSHHLEEIEAQILRLTGIIDDLLTMSQLDNAEIVFGLEQIDVNELLDDVISNQQTLAREKRQNLILKQAPHQIVIEADRTQLTRAFSNLLTNAINYTPYDGKIMINVVVKNHEALVEISDTGVGIAITDLPHIFERFYRADKARSTAKGGTGLGLSIVKKIIEAHKGTIEVTSTQDQGSTFTIQLPLLIAIPDLQKTTISDQSS